MHMNGEHSITRGPDWGAAWPVLKQLAMSVVVLFSGLLPAMALEQTVSFDDLADARNLAASIADPDSRADTLTTMLAVARLHNRLSATHASTLDTVSASFIEERAWLDRLARRYGTFTQRGSVIDPPAWLVQSELEQHDLEANDLITPLGPDFGSITDQLFDRSDEALAAAMLPEALLRVEVQAVHLWQSLLSQAGASEEVHALISDLNAAWFDEWMAAESPAPSGKESGSLEGALQGLLSVAASAIEAGPPDALELKRLRFELLMATPSMDATESNQAARLLRLATALDGLHEHKYLAFAEALLWSVTDLLASASLQPSVQTPAADASLADAMEVMLPRLSNVYARQFSETDPRINAVIAGAYDVVQMLQSGPLDRQTHKTLKQELADSVVQIGLLMPDFDFYTGQPVRRQLSQEIDICISIAANRDSNGDYTLSREQFDACLKSMVDLADSLARGAELAGDANGPFGTDQLRRELALTPWQRINYTLGYITYEFSTACRIAETLPNPLEWSVLATLVAWLADRSPVYFQTSENEAQILRMRKIGVELQQALSRQADCLAGTGTGLSDPVSRSLTIYRKALLALVSGIRNAELRFRNSHLKAGADVVLTEDSAQLTAYRMAELEIGPCDPENICEMGAKLEPTRALIGLFPSEYLIAEQTGLGTLEICYDKMSWIDRRSSPVRADDENVANYHGRLSFQLIGKYHERDQARNVFGWSFSSPDEYHYLFGAANQEVLDDECPVEWVGTKIVTMMPSDGGFQVVPRRLTYLSSARTRPSQVIAANWSRGSEWRDWFVTGIGVSPVAIEADSSVDDRIDQHLLDLYLAERVSLYQALLGPGTRRIGGGASLRSLVDELSTYKALIRTILFLFYPDSFVDSDALRAAMEGLGGLLDESVIQRFREGNVAVESIGDIGIARADRFQAQWNRLPDEVRRSGNVAGPIAYAMLRLNTTYKRFFALPEPTENQPSSAESGSE